MHNFKKAKRKDQLSFYDEKTGKKINKRQNYIESHPTSGYTSPESPSPKKLKAQEVFPFRQRAKPESELQNEIEMNQMLGNQNSTPRKHPKKIEIFGDDDIETDLKKEKKVPLAAKQLNTKITFGLPQSERNHFDPISSPDESPEKFSNVIQKVQPITQTQKAAFNFKEDSFGNQHNAKMLKEDPKIPKIVPNQRKDQNEKQKSDIPQAKEEEPPIKDSAGWTKVSSDLLIGPSGQSLQKIVQIVKEVKPDGCIVETQKSSWRQIDPPKKEESPQKEPEKEIPSVNNKELSPDKPVQEKFRKVTVSHGIGNLEQHKCPQLKPASKSHEIYPPSEKKEPTSKLEDKEKLAKEPILFQAPKKVVKLINKGVGVDLLDTDEEEKLAHPKCSNKCDSPLHKHTENCRMHKKYDIDYSPHDLGQEYYSDSEPQSEELQELSNGDETPEQYSDSEYGYDGENPENYGFNRYNEDDGFPIQFKEFELNTAQSMPYSSGVQITEDCPVEDPRNPYHKRYLELKEIGDGHMVEKPSKPIHKKHSSDKRKKVKRSRSRKNISKFNHRPKSAVKQLVIQTQPALQIVSRITKSPIKRIGEVGKVTSSPLRLIQKTVKYPQVYSSPTPTHSMKISQPVNKSPPAEIPPGLVSAPSFGQNLKLQSANMFHHKNIEQPTHHKFINKRIEGEVSNLSGGSQTSLFTNDRSTTPTKTDFDTSQHVNKEGLNLNFGYMNPSEEEMWSGEERGTMNMNRFKVFEKAVPNKQFKKPLEMTPEEQKRQILQEADVNSLQIKSIDMLKSHPQNQEKVHKFRPPTAFELENNEEQPQNVNFEAPKLFMPPSNLIG